VSRPKLLDLFCGQFGAGAGYHRAGFDVYGVDNEPTRAPFAPFPLHIGDAIEVMVALNAGKAIDFTRPSGTIEWLKLTDFTATHGSPPCTGFSRGTAAIPDRLTRYDRLIAVTREAMILSELPYVIENVEDAGPELINPMRLCGFEFGLSAVDDDGTVLKMKRHRLFESNVFLVGAGGCPGHPHDGTQIAGAYGGARRDKVEARKIRKGGYVPKSLGVLRAMLGTPWMDETGCFLSIPPVYTEFIGAQLLAHIESEAVA
jgi:DNA (cytosine-5)-methyltransferase 1